MTTSRLSLLCALLAASSLFAVTPSEAALKCPRIYRPVCAVAPNGVNQTYANSCVARAAHARILAPGKCLGPFCPLVFDPVCAQIPGQPPRTFSSLCFAELDHATLIHKGACK